MLNMMAFDMGASSGRGILGKFDGEKLAVEEMHRFSNDPVQIAGSLYWDVLRLFWEIRQGLIKTAGLGYELKSIGIDTWGVDFGLLDVQGDLISNPYHYRDGRTEGMMDKAFSRMPREEIFKKTGIAFQKFNTLFQLVAMVEKKPHILEKADCLLFMPDLLSYFLTGAKAAEYTEASTGQLIDVHNGDWCMDLMNCMGIPSRIFPKIEIPGSIRGRVMPEIAREVGVGNIPVVAVAAHDTASAVVGVPATDDDYAYISSGTWSLMGVEVKHPVINRSTLDWNYTNEGGMEGRYRLLKNIMGLWIVQECKREWDKSGNARDFGQLAIIAESSRPFMAFIDPDDDIFYRPGNMPEKIRNYCFCSGQYVPETKGEILRCVFESLALKYRWSLNRLEEILGRTLKVLHVVGGGAKNELLNQFTANAANRPVICGPTEAAAIGNLMVQAQACGEVENLYQIRQVIKASFPTKDFMPKDVEQWNEAYARFVAKTSLDK